MLDIPAETIHDRHTAVGEAARIDDQSQQSVVAAAKALLLVIDNAPIRQAAVACGHELYTASAALLDAIAAAEKEWQS